MIMKTTLYLIQKVFQRNMLCLLMLSLAMPVLAQEDVTAAEDDEDATEEVKRPARQVEQEKYELMTVKGNELTFID